MRHLKQMSVARAQTWDDLPDEFQDTFVLRIIVALAALLKGSSPF